MVRAGLTGQRLVALFLLGMVALNGPVLLLADQDRWVLGFPVLYVYLFGVWALLVGLMAWICERRR